MYLIKATEDFRSLAERVCLKNEELTVEREGLRAMTLEDILQRREISNVVATYYRDESKIYVVIVVPPPSQSPRDRAAVGGSSPSGGLQTTYEVVVRKSDREEKITLQNGDTLRLDEDEKMEATSGGIAFILLQYDVVLESYDHSGCSIGSGQ
ncbi:hypothetical protein B0H63DRAFT_450017 [Podospora didyma]|uniref:Uncharacterized protein n=1 Tax=Podospora didyma TaxID=330526 RepID=A0AAE0NQW4_9PEZI|nr:hypothetical protein B0H63DRAFT_450017 [Podospora didyma]